MDIASTTARLADEAAIRRLVATYSDAVAHRDADRAASIYAEDGVVSIMGNALHGRAAIAEGMRQSFSAFSLIQMIAHGGLIDVHGDTARGRWPTIELTVKEGDQALSCIFGRYEDELVRLPEGWRFRKRTFSMAGRTLLDAAKVQLIPGFVDALQFTF
jgi:ketosteroid isomerase-like protein